MGSSLALGAGTRGVRGEGVTVGGSWWRFLVALTVLVPASWMSRPATGAPARPDGVPVPGHAFIVVLQDGERPSVLSSAGMPNWPTFRLPPWP
jgi:hypothetical protein